MAVNHNGRWAPPWRATTLLLRQGAIGEVVGVTHLHDKPLPPLVGTPFDDVPHMLLTDYLLHWVDITRTWLGDITSVQAVDSRVPGQPDEARNPWSATLSMATAVGATATLRIAGSVVSSASPAALSGCTAPPARCAAACCSAPTGSSSTTASSDRRAAVGRVVRRRVRRRHGRADVRRAEDRRARELRRRRRAPRCSWCSPRPRVGRAGRRARRPGRGAGVSADRLEVVDEVPVDPAHGPGLRRGLAELEPRDLVPRRRDGPATGRGVAAHHALPARHADRPGRRAGRGPAGGRPRRRQPGSLLRRDRARSTSPPSRATLVDGDASSCGRPAPSTSSRPPTRRPRSRRTPTRSPACRSTAATDCRRRRSGAPGTATSSRSPPPTCWRTCVPSTSTTWRSTWSRSTTAGARASVKGCVVADRFGSLDGGRRRGPRDRTAGGHLGGTVPRRRAHRPWRPQHPQWVVGDAGRNWGDDLVGLDLTHPGVLDLLAETFTRLVDLGIDYFKLDFLYAGAVPGRRLEDLTGVEAYRSGLSLVREVVGPDAVAGRVRRAAPAERRAGRRDAGLPRHLPRGRRGRLARPARSDAAGRTGLAAGPLLGQRPRLPGGPAVVRPAGAVGRRGRGPSAGWRRSRDRVADLDDHGLTQVRELLARGGTAEPFAAATDPRGRPRRRSWSCGDRRAWRTLAPASRRTSSCSTPTSTRRCAAGSSRWPRRTPTGSAAATVAPPTQRTACLITYGDGIRRADETPLHTLAGFLHDQVGDLVSDVHLLPMFPWTSDDGFAVVDHRAVNPALGTWDDVADLAGEHDLMFDFVANHTSSSSPWFTGWLAGDPAYDGLLRRARPRLRRLARDPAAHHAAVPRLPAAGRHPGVGLDDVRRGPGRRRRPAPRDPASS